MQTHFGRGSLRLGESHGRTFARKLPKSGQQAIWRITFVSVSCLKDSVANSILFIAPNCFRRPFRQSCNLDFVTSGQSALNTNSLRRAATRIVQTNTLAAYIPPSDFGSLHFTSAASSFPLLFRTSPWSLFAPTSPSSDHSITTYISQTFQ